MANVTVSSAVDTMLRSANNSAIRSNIQAMSQGEIENEDFVFNESVEFDGQCIVNTTLEANDAVFADGVEFQGSTEFQDDAQFQSLVEFDSDQGVEFTSGGSIIGVSNINTISLNASSFVKVSPINPSSISSPSNGMIIYNSSTNKFQGRANGVWVDLH
tara:strand:- start:182 stop:658 length:477 start_codon:yes stop_codon:yes gene_type:complete